MLQDINLTSLASLADDESEVTIASLIKDIDDTALCEEKEILSNNATLGEISVINNIVALPITHLSEFPNQPFKPYTGEKLNNLLQSIKFNGILTPIIVREIENNSYQIISGHNRVKVCESLGISTIPCIVKSLDDDQAWIELIENNLNQRQDLLPSERAWAYRIRQEKLGKKVGRPTTTDKSCHEWHNLPDGEKENDNDDTARRTLYRYIRLTYLLPELLELVDSGDIPIVAGEEISNISDENQAVVFEWLKSGEKISPVIANKIKKLVESQSLTVELLKKTFEKHDNKDKSKTDIVLKMPTIRKIVGNDISQKELTTLIIELLKRHYIKEEKNNDN